VGKLPRTPFLDPLPDCFATGLFTSSSGLGNAKFQLLHQSQLQGFAKRAKALNLQPIHPEQGFDGAKFKRPGNHGEHRHEGEEVWVKR